MSGKAFKAISNQDVAQLKSAIAAAEKRTSGEIRLFIEDSSADEPLDRAAYLFGELEMHKTDLRNGVLIYLAFVDRKFSIIGDKGLHEKVGDTFWDDIKGKMLANFKEGKIVHGLQVAIHEAGEALRTHFPFEKGDTNELSDDIVFGDGKL